MIKKKSIFIDTINKFNNLGIKSFNWSFMIKSNWRKFLINVDNFLINIIKNSLHK